MDGTERVVVNVDGDLALNLTPEELHVLAALIERANDQETHNWARPPLLDIDLPAQLRTIAFAKSASGPKPRPGGPIPSLSTKQVAAQLGVDEATVREHCRQRRLPGAHKPGRDWQIPPSALATMKGKHSD